MNKQEQKEIRTYAGFVTKYIKSLNKKISNKKVRAICSQIYHKHAEKENVSDKKTQKV